MKTRFVLTVLCCIMAFTASAQQKMKYKLDERDQMSIQRAAVDKVNRFQSNCAKIASENTPEAIKSSYITTAMKDFRETAKITVTSFNGKPQKPKLVSEYLDNLMGLGKRYARVQITWTECHMTDEFEYDANTGMYVGWAKVKQTFNALTWERLSVGDEVERTIKIYAKRTNIYEKNRIRKKWCILLGDIAARNI